MLLELLASLVFVCEHFKSVSSSSGLDFRLFGAVRIIEHNPCFYEKTGETGTCMFAWDCLYKNGTHLTFCRDRFYYGSCCRLPPGSEGQEDIPNISTLGPSTKSTPSFIEPYKKPSTTTTSTTTTTTSTTTTTTTPTTTTTTTTTTTERPSSLTSFSTTTSSTVGDTIPTNDVTKLSTEPSTLNSVATAETIPTTMFQTRPPLINNHSGTRRPVITRKPTQTTVLFHRTSLPLTTTASTTSTAASTLQTNPAIASVNPVKPNYTTTEGTVLTSAFSTFTPGLITWRPLEDSTRPGVNFTTPPTIEDASITKRPIIVTVSKDQLQFVTKPKPLATTTTTHKKPDETTISSVSFSDQATSQTKPDVMTTIPVKHVSQTWIIQDQADAQGVVTTQTPVEASTEPTTISGVTVTDMITSISWVEESTTSKSIATSTMSSVEDTTVSKLAADITTTEIKPIETKPSTETSTVTSTAPTTTASTTIKRLPPTTIPTSTTTMATTTTTTQPLTTISTTTPSTTTTTTTAATTTTTTSTTTTALPTTEVKKDTETTPIKPSTPSTTEAQVIVGKPIAALDPLPSTTGQMSSSTVNIPVSTAAITASLSVSTTNLAHKPTTNSASKPTSPGPSADSVQMATTVAPSDSLDETNIKKVCGRPKLFPTARIVGGEGTKFAQWPWMISLRQFKKNTFLHKCGAALLNEYWAVSAAHCVHNVSPNDILLRLGEYDLSGEQELLPHMERRVQIVATHPKFDATTFEYDLALMRFYEPIQFAPNIIPVCIPETNDTFVGRDAVVTGWGRLYEDGPLPSILQKVKVPIITNKECERMYRKAGFIEDIPNIFICAGLATGGKDSCEGDSGGPLVLKDNATGQWQLIGIISWGIGCALPNQPGVYTRITHFADWIRQIIVF